MASFSYRKAFVSFIQWRKIAESLASLKKLRRIEVAAYCVGLGKGIEHAADLIKIELTPFLADYAVVSGE